MWIIFRRTIRRQMARRRRGEGSIGKRSDGRGWRARWRGHTLCAKTERAVVEALNKLKSGDDPKARENPTVKSFLASWLSYIEKQVRPNTYVTYAFHANAIASSDIGPIRLAKLMPLDVQRMMDDYGKSPSSVRHRRVVLKMALDMAVRWELVRRNVAAQVKPPKKSRPDIQPFTENELAQIMNAAAGDPHEALWLLALGTGARKGELRGSTWADYDLIAGTFRVTRTLQPCGLLPPKSENSTRTIHLPAKVVDALKRWRAVQREIYMAAKLWKEEYPLWVFTSPVGTPIETRALDKLYKALLKRAGVKDHRFHDMRHSYATHTLSAGVPAHQVAEQMGDTVQTVLSVYAHVLKSKERTGADVMDGLL